MNIQERIDSFAELGKVLRNLLSEKDRNDSFGLFDMITNQHLKNPWFTFENVSAAINSIAGELTEENLIKWTNAYPELSKTCNPVKVGVIMAGNIPLVGFHDFLSVLISGNILRAKTSSKDSELIVKIGEILCSIEPRFKENIEFAAGPLTDYDVVIATGNNNSSRYFEHYFGKYPNIIRKNRNSIAIIEGDETETELKSLGTDIFLYFGLGCRNVSKIFIPKGYDLSALVSNLTSFASIIKNTKYGNNYNFNKALYFVNKDNFLDTGYLLLKEDQGLSSPVSVLYYEYYDSHYALQRQTDAIKEKIQCVVGSHYVPFGKAQSPHLWDYADGIDTLGFLLQKKKTGIL
jgi:hypothetical protein